MPTDPDVIVTLIVIVVAILLSLTIAALLSEGKGRK